MISRSPTDAARLATAHSGASEAVAAGLVGLFPRWVATAAVAVGPARMQPRRWEEAAVARAGAARRQQFAAGRRCAHAALQGVGRDVPVVAQGPAGQPLWPTGAVGSIAHTDSVAVAAAARSQDAVSLGLDLEDLEPPLEATVARLICADDELTAAAVPTALRPHASKLVFCAKECVYKALFPLTGWRLQPHEMRVEVNAHRDRFRAETTPVGSGVPQMSLHGRLLVTAGCILAGALITERTAAPW